MNEFESGKKEDGFDTWFPGIPRILIILIWWPIYACYKLIMLNGHLAYKIIFLLPRWLFTAPDPKKRDWRKEAKENGKK